MLGMRILSYGCAWKFGEHKRSVRVTLASCSWKSWFGKSELSQVVFLIVHNDVYFGVHAAVGEDGLQETCIQHHVRFFETWVRGELQA